MKSTLPTPLSYTLFSTPIGWCSLVWNQNKIISVFLAETNEARAKKLIKKNYPDAAEQKTNKWIKHVIDQIQQQLRGKEVTFDLSLLLWTQVTPFQKMVYQKVAQIPLGKVKSYADIAKSIGKPKGARAVGTAMGKNPFPLIIPCHRIINQNGKLGGFSAPGSLDTKAKLLHIEKVPL